MKPTIVSTARSATLLPRFAQLQTPALRQSSLSIYRSYATDPSSGGSSSSAARRRAVTPFNDDGHVPWTELSAGEKTGRAAQQTFNFGFILVGLVMTGGVAYFLFTDVFSPNSKTAYYNSAVDRIKKDPRCLELLGDASKITAHGEPTASKWRRSRPIASTEYKDAQGNDHLLIHFYVEGPRNHGHVNIHVVRQAGQREFQYRYLYVDVKGQQRIYLEHATGAGQAGGDKSKQTMFGIRWT